MRRVLRADCLFANEAVEACLDVGLIERKMFDMGASPDAEEPVFLSIRRCRVQGVLVLDRAVDIGKDAIRAEKVHDSSAIEDLENRRLDSGQADVDCVTGCCVDDLRYGVRSL